MKEPMIFRRTGTQTFFVALYFVLLAGAAAYFLRDGYATGRIVMTVLGIALASWAGFTALNLIRRGTYGELHKDRLILRYASQDKVILFDRMEWADIPDGKAGGIIGYRPEGQETQRQAAFSQRLLGAEGVAEIKRAIKKARPKLPQEPPFMKGKT